MSPRSICWKLSPQPRAPLKALTSSLGLIHWSVYTEWASRWQDLIDEYILDSVCFHFMCITILLVSRSMNYKYILFLLPSCLCFSVVLGESFPPPCPSVIMFMPCHSPKRDGTSQSWIEISETVGQHDPFHSRRWFAQIQWQHDNKWPTVFFSLHF